MRSIGNTPPRFDSADLEDRVPTSSGPHPYVGGDLFISVKAVEWVFENSESSGNARNVLLVLAAHYREGSSWPSFERIAKLANVSRPTLSKAISELEDIGELQVERAEGTVNNYTFPKFEAVNTSKVSGGNQLSFSGKPVNPPLPKKVLLEEIEKEEVDASPVQEDPKQVFRECKRYYRKIAGKNPGTVPPSRGEEWLRWIEKKSGDVVFEAFKLWAEENKDWLKRERPKWPMAIFMKSISEHIEAYEDKIAGEREEEDEDEDARLPRLVAPE